MRIPQEQSDDQTAARVVQPPPDQAKQGGYPLVPEAGCVGYSGSRPGTPLDLVGRQQRQGSGAESVPQYAGQIAGRSPDRPRWSGDHGGGLGGCATSGVGSQYSHSQAAHSEQSPHSELVAH